MYFYKDTTSLAPLYSIYYGPKDPNYVIDNPKDMSQKYPLDFKKKKIYKK